MRVLIDTDAFCKLGACDLLEEAVQLLGATLGECGRLRTLVPMLQRGRIARRLGSRRCQLLQRLAQRIPEAPQVDSPWLERMVAEPDIDPGEAQLLASVAEGDLLLLSGDKRAMVAAASVSGLPEALAGKLVTIEAVLMALHRSLGPDETKRRIQAILDFDVALRVCFSGDDCERGLASYQRDLESRVGKLVLWRVTTRRGGP